VETTAETVPSPHKKSQEEKAENQNKEQKPKKRMKTIMSPIHETLPPFNFI